MTAPMFVMCCGILSRCLIEDTWRHYACAFRLPFDTACTMQWPNDPQKYDSVVLREWRTSPNPIPLVDFNFDIPVEASKRTLIVDTSVSGEKWAPQQIEALKKAFAELGFNF